MLKSLDFLTWYPSSGLGWFLCYPKACPCVLRITRAEMLKIKKSGHWSTRTCAIQVGFLWGCKPPALVFGGLINVPLIFSANMVTIVTVHSKKIHLNPDFLEPYFSSEERILLPLHADLYWKIDSALLRSTSPCHTANLFVAPFKLTPSLS